MASTLFTGAGQPNIQQSVATGATRFNTSSHHYEVFDGANWITLGTGREETMQEMVQHLEDRIGVLIEENYADSVAIQDAFKAWEEATERFKVILAIVEQNK